MCKILSRIKIIADSEGITIGAIERAIGASRGVISKAIAKGTDIQSKWLELICENFPSYSPLWLLTGQGSMLRDTSTNTIKTAPDAKIITQAPSFTPPINTSDALSDRVMAYIREKDQEIGRLNQEIGRLNAKIEELERVGLQKAPPVYAPSPEPETVPT